MTSKRLASTLALIVLLASAAQPVYARNDKVMVCHKDKHTIVVDDHAVPAHLAHGDKVGPCGPGFPEE
jgi:hypothetical protein